ncbi:RNA polymerase sigma factor [Oceanobacillus oncorhynchi]|uniref:RNA polymerase sigma factor n=1 Tax=Oceanobacillus oncorhynchi TaxID=545501 RepID=UPI0034D5DAAE
MIEPNRTEWQIRCAFNAFCKRVLKNEVINITREKRQRKLREMTFSGLTPQEESQLYSIDKFYEGEDTQAFKVDGKKITSELLEKSLYTLTKEKRIIVLLAYFFYMTDIEVSQLLEIPRSTVQYRRTSALKRLKRYLEEHAND